MLLGHKPNSNWSVRESTGRSQRLAVVLGGGRNALGVLRGLAMRGVRTWLIYLTKNDIASYSRMPDKRMFVRANGGGDLQDQVLAVLDESVPSGTVLIPTSDPLVEILARNRVQLSSRFLLPMAWAETPLETFLDKWREAEFLRSHSVPSPATLHISSTPISDIAGRLGCPLVIKPRREADVNVIGAKATVVPDRSRFDDWANTRQKVIDKFVFQEYIPGGQEALWSCHAVFDERSSLVQAFTFHSLTTLPPGTGAVTSAVSCRNEKLIEMTASLGKAFSYVGPANLDFKYDDRDQQFKYLEWNARTGASNWFGTVCGVNLAYAAYCVAVGLPCPSMGVQNEKMLYVDLAGDIESRRESGASWSQIANACLKRLFKKKTHAYWWYFDPVPGPLAWSPLIQRGIDKLLQRRNRR